MKRISETDLILNSDGSIYHLSLFPGDIADTVITVGDQERVGEISKYFDEIEFEKAKREFVTHTGRIGNKRITVISTGIGTDNIDIVFNELDALVNIDLDKRVANSSLKQLDIIRIGTSGAVQEDIPVDSLLVSSAAIGLEPLMHYYEYAVSENDQAVLSDFKQHIPSKYQIYPYIAPCDEELLQTIGANLEQGITVTAPGFYASQGRQVRAASRTPDLLKILQTFRSGNRRITNLEMETAGIYGLSASLGHRALSFNVILANRISNKFSKDPAKIMDHYIKDILERICTIE
jgi:uridine phosphorylase